MFTSNKLYIKNKRVMYKALNIFLPDAPFRSLPHTYRIIYHKMNSSQTSALSSLIIALPYSRKTNNLSPFNFTPLLKKRTRRHGCGRLYEGKLINMNPGKKK
jgi:hypothetical protein